MIKKRGDKFVVTDKSGTKTLGTHPTKEKAAKQLAAIEISKAKHMSENKRFKAFRNELNESEYKETLTGYPNRGIDTDVGPANANLLMKVNAVLNSLNRFTYQNTNDALVKIRTRLNLFMLDFPWTPWMWQGGMLGGFAVPVTLFGRVDGTSGMAGAGGIRFDGKASPDAGLQEFTLSITVETAEDGLYRVTAKLMPKVEVMPEGVEEDGDAVTEDFQTDAREAEMKRKVQKHEDIAQRGYQAKMTQSGKAAARGRKQEAKHDAASRRVLKKDQAEQDSPRTYGRGGKLIKRGSRREVKEEIQAIDEAGQAKLERLGKAYDKARIGSRGVLNPERKKELGDAYFKMRDTVLDKRKKRIAAGTFDKEKELQQRVAINKKKFAVKEGAEQIDEKKMKTWSPRLDKLMKNRDKVYAKTPAWLKRQKESKKAVKEGAEQIDELSKKTLDAYVAKRGSQLQQMTTGLDRYRNLLTGKKQANAVKGIKQAMGVKEELIGGQKRLDVNKNKKLDAQDFKMLRNKKKPVQEEMGKPKKMLVVNKMKDGKKVSSKLIPAYTPKKTVKEYTEMMPSIPLQVPDPTEARADKSGKGKRFHKGAIKSVEEAVAKTKKKKPSAHQGAANVIGKQKSIKSMLQKHDMRW